jgi:hypothetical protein
VCVFGWLAHRDLYRRAGAGSSIAACWLNISPRTLAQELPALGCVLYLPGRRPGAGPDVTRLPYGVLAESAELAPLLETRWLRAASAVSELGPREWLDCVDAGGRVQARLYLLPDTDYLAWDALLASGQPAAAPAGRTGAAGFRAEGARLVCFRRRQLPSLASLGQAVPGRVSALSRSLARDIARAEAVAPPVAAG